MNRKELLVTCIEGMLRFEDNFDKVTQAHAGWISERLFWHKLMPLAAALNDPQKEKCPVLTEVFLKVQFQNKIREDDYFKQVSLLFERFSHAKIEFIPYKGPFWGRQLYPEYSWRHIGDIDLLMSREKARDVSAMLQEEGFVPDIVGESESDDFHRRGELTLFPGPSLKNHFPIQLHWELLPSPRFIGSRYLLPEDFFNSTVQADWRGVPFNLPGPEVQFLYHVLHATCQHQFLRFSHILTMAHFLAKYPGMDLNSLFRLAEKRHALPPLHYALRFIHAFSPLQGEALYLMKQVPLSPKVRLAAGILTPRSTLFSTKKRGGFRRKVFRVAMSW